MTRFLLLVALAALVATTATAQPVYNGLDDPYYDESDSAPGVRLGLGIGAFIYDGPDRLVGDPAFQSDAVDTNLGVTAELTFPLADQVYGRLLGGLVNLGAEDLPYTNPYLTETSILAEADLLLYLSRPGAGQLSPYLFSGISALFPTEDAPGVDSPAFAIPVGLGVEYGVSRNLALFVEGSYRFGLTDVGTSTVASALASAGDDEKEKHCKKYPEKPECDEEPPPPTCEEDPTQPGCPAVDPDGDDAFDGRFNTGLILGGLRLGFGGAPPAPVIPPPPPPVVPAPPPPPVAPPAPLVCDLVELNSIYFDYGSGSLDRRARALLDENVELLLSNPACCVFIDGFTDTPEGSRFGMGLAGQRAQAVYDYYLSQGVGASRLQIRNRGVAAPDCDKEDPGPGCERNRRVESLPVDCERFRFLLDNPSYDPY
jgi:outer membrane protein OmpA-like peptidoglycan-associated protein/opacity protein-like surface antigen